MTWLTILASLFSLAGGAFWWFTRHNASREADARADANAKTAEKYRHEAEIHSMPERDLASIIRRMRERDDD